MQKRRLMIIGFAVIALVLLLFLSMQLLVGVWIPRAVEQSFPTHTSLDVRTQTAQRSYTVHSVG